MTTVADALDPVDAVRLLMADVGSAQYLTDPQIGNYIKLAADGNLRLAAADAIEAIAVSEVLVGKVIQTQDLRTDGAAVSKALLALADRRRAQGEAEVAAAGGGGFGFEISSLGARPVPEHTGTPVWGL